MKEGVLVFQDGERLHFTFREDILVRLGTKLFDMAGEVEKAPGDEIPSKTTLQLQAILVEVLASWDLTEESTPVPISLRIFARLPMTFPYHLLDTMLKTTFPSLQK